MNLSAKELKIVKSLDDGSLYASPEIVHALFDYPHMAHSQLRVHFAQNGIAMGYLPVGQYYQDGTLSYIAAMPNSPPVSATYPPGAIYILETLTPRYFDTDIVSSLPLPQAPTASAYVLPSSQYLSHLSATRRKDIRRKLKQAQHYLIVPGTLQDVRAAWPWMTGIWDKREGRFGEVSYSDYLEMTLHWLEVLERSQRTVLKIDKYLLNDQMVGINCCVMHRYHKQTHCDDYLTWYDPNLASGLGIVSAVRNLTHPQMQGYRYNLGNPGINGIAPGHEYKMALIPPTLRLTQTVIRVFEKIPN